MPKARTPSPLARRIAGALESSLGAGGPGLSLESIKEDVRLGSRTVALVATLRAPPPGRERAIVLAESKSRGEPYFLRQAAAALLEVNVPLASSRLRAAGDAWVARVVVAPYISSRGFEVCRRLGVGAIDLEGNSLVSVGPFSVERQGPRRRGPERRIARSLFSPRASRITRALLEEPTRVWRLSDLASVTGLSLGHTHAVVRKLELEEFIERDSARRVHVGKPGDLLEAWSAANDIMSIPRLAYFSPRQTPELLMDDLRKSARKHRLPYALTLQAGASLIAPFVRFDRVHLYARRSDADRWAKALGLRPADAGANIIFLLPPDDGVYHKKQRTRGFDVVCNSQLYVDLARYPARGREQADFLRERKLGF